MGAETTQQDVDDVIRIVSEAVFRLRSGT